MLGMGISEIERLTREEGLYDHEIALLLGVDRSTVIRARVKHDIPAADLSKRKDKVSHCNRCKKKFIIRRGLKRNLCFDCEPLVDGLDTISKEVVRWKRKREQRLQQQTSQE